MKLISETFPFWFCQNYQQYKEREETIPFDQHYLLASIAPRYVCVGSASEDDWADPVSEYLSCHAVSRFFKEKGTTGFIAPDRLPAEDEEFLDGALGYHKRKGRHFFRRKDWHRIIKFVNQHRDK